MSDNNLQIFLSHAAVFGIGVVWLLINQAVFYTVSDIVEEAFYERYQAVELEHERYPADESK